MGLPAEKHRYTIQEYLQLEERAVDRHEFHNGEILAMSGGTHAHSVINANVIATLHSKLKGSPCVALESNMRVRIAHHGDYAYPDASVVCGKAQFDPDDVKKTTIINPRVVVEVLSDSTESYDRGAKFTLYRQIPSLEEYILVSQREPQIETFLQQPDGSWLFNAWKGSEASAMVRSLDVTLPLAEIYSRVEFEESIRSAMRSALPDME